MPGEWHGSADPVMPVRHDVHRTFDAAFLADEATADRRPGQDLGAGCRAGRRPCVDRTSRLSIGCCRSRDRRRSIPPGCQEYLSVDRECRRCEAIADDFAAEDPAQISISCGSEPRRVDCSVVAGNICRSNHAISEGGPTATRSDQPGSLVESAIDDFCAMIAPTINPPIARSAEAMAPPNIAVKHQRHY